MQDKIVLNLIGSPLEYTIMVNDTTIPVKLDDIPTVINQLAQDHGITKCYVCASKKFFEPIEKEIRAVAKLEYSNNNLEIEVISE